MTDEARHWDDKFHQELAKDSDRATAIVAAALLEQALTTLLRNHLAPCGSQDDPLFEGAYAPVAAFSAKIDLAHRLGLLSQRWCRDLHLIRKVRNAFAHNVAGCTFEDTSVRSRILELSRSQKAVEAFPSLRGRYPEGPKGDFALTLSWMLWQLWYQAERVRQIPPAGDWLPGPPDELESAATTSVNVANAQAGRAPSVAVAVAVNEADSPAPAPVPGIVVG